MVRITKRSCATRILGGTEAPRCQVSWAVTEAVTGAAGNQVRTLTLSKPRAHVPRIGNAIGRTLAFCNLPQFAERFCTAPHPSASFRNFPQSPAKPAPSGHTTQAPFRLTRDCPDHRSNCRPKGCQTRHPPFGKAPSTPHSHPHPSTTCPNFLQPPWLRCCVTKSIAASKRLWAVRVAQANCRPICSQR